MTELPSKPSKSVLWGQVWGLAAVQGAITLTWVIYNLYLVDLLTGLGFPASLATGLLILENLLAMVMEPLMGSFSDQFQHRIGTRFPLISLGIILSAGLFLAIPTVLFWGQGPLLRWLLPLLMVAWALAMTVFRSPALSLLGRYAFRTQLPQAASILTLVGGVTGAAGPLANQFILGMGPVVAFTAGSGVLLLATVALSRCRPNESLLENRAEDEGLEGSEGDRTKAAGAMQRVQPVAKSALSFKNLGLIFGAGVGIALGFRMVMSTFPALLRQQVPEANPAWVMGVIFIFLALTAIPTGALATRLGNRRAMILGLALMTGLTAVMLTVHTLVFGLVIGAFIGGSFSLVANGTLPFALALVPPDRAGLGTGLYFSGGSAAMTLFGSLLQGTSLAAGAWLGALAFLLAGLCVGLARPPIAPSAAAPGLSDAGVPS